MKITEYSHTFTISDFSKALVPKINKFALNYAVVSIRKDHFTGEVIRKVEAMYGAAFRDRSQYHFHRHCIDNFMDFCKMNSISYSHEVVPLYEPVKVEYKAKGETRDYQEGQIDYATSPGRTKLIGLQTGKGKTFCALQATGEIGVRTAISLRGGFVHRWVPDISAILGLKPKEMYVIRGAKDMINLIDEAKRGELKVKLMIFTSSTLDMFYTHFTSTNGDVEKYGCNPLDLWKLLGVGFVIRDEVHMEFHKNFRQDLFSHILKVLSLSATLISSDSTMSRMHTLMYPPDSRAPVIPYDKYIAASALTYCLKNPGKVKTTQRGRRDYSHTAYEDWIMTDKNRLLTYESIVTKWVLDHYIKHSVEGQKAVVFCATVKLCTQLQATLQKKFPDKRVRRFVASDPKEHLTDVDIIVTTILSAGTAQDIEGLRYTLMTVNINSMQSNVQTLGRLRRLKDWPDVIPEFYYLICLDIPKHVEYMKEKHNTFNGLVLSHGCSDLGVYI